MADRSYLDDFFWLDPLGVAESDLAIVDDGMSYEEIQCPADVGHRRPGRRIGPLRVVLQSKTMADFVWTGEGDLLVNDRVRKALASNEFTGYELYRAVVREDEGSAIDPSLWEVVVKGSAGFASPESGVRVVDGCSVCGHVTYSVPTDMHKLILRSAWDGSDFFLVWPLPRYIFVSRRVASLLKDRSFSGISVLPIAELSFEPNGTLTSGPRESWAPVRVEAPD
jgi:hypothetical protein